MRKFSKDPNAPFVNYRVRSRVCEKGTLIVVEVSKPSIGMVTKNSKVVLNCQLLKEGTANLLVLDKTLLSISCEFVKLSK